MRVSRGHVLTEIKTLVGQESPVYFVRIGILLQKRSVAVLSLFLAAELGKSLGCDGTIHIKGTE